MPKKIKWSEKADSDFQRALEFLSSNWNNSIAFQFIQTIEDNLNRIERNPDLYPYINKELKIRRCIITKHNTLYYKLNGDDIIVLRIYDTRQDPNSLQYY